MLYFIDCLIIHGRKKDAQLIIFALRGSGEVSNMKKYLNEYSNIKELQKAIANYMDSYNKKRLHSSLGYKTPNEVYYQADNNLVSNGIKLLPLVS